MLASTASAYIQSVKFIPNPVVAGQPYEIHVTVSDPGPASGEVGRKWVMERTVDPSIIVDDRMYKGPKVINAWHSALDEGGVCRIGDASLVVPTANHQYIMTLEEYERVQFPGGLGDKRVDDYIDYSMTFSAVPAPSTNPDPTGSIPPSTNIPEFPSVIAPVAAILGLFMIFGRRKT